MSWPAKSKKEIEGNTAGARDGDPLYSLEPTVTGSALVSDWTVP